MIITFALLVLAVAFAIFLVLYGLRSVAGDRNEFEPVSMPALMNLINERNLEFLERSLPAGEYRAARRDRIRVLRAYVRRIANNARLLIAEAERAVRDANPEVAQSGRQLLESSLATRTLAMRALASLYVAGLFPQLLPDLAEAVRSYQSAESTSDSLHALGAH